MHLDKFERYPLLWGKSPIHPLKRLSQHLGGAQIWAKREDVNSVLAFGGNKTRKLEYILPDAIAQGADTLVSIGGVQSNHTRQVAAAAAVLGMKCHVVQEHWVDWPDSVYDRVGNILLSRIMGADVELNPAGFDIGLRDSWKRAMDAVRAKGGKPYPIPAGGSVHPLGALGFVNFAREVEEQERELGIFFDYIIVCSVTGSTQAGMVVGFADQARPRQVVGIDASAKPEATHAQIVDIARRTAELVELGRSITAQDVILRTEWSGEYYGIADQKTIEAIKLAGRTEAMLTDPVYEGKSMAALIDMVGSGEIPKDKNVLFVHLGGAPALNAYSALFPA